MSSPYSTGEIGEGYCTEGFYELPECEQNWVLDRLRNQKKSDKLESMGYGYYLDNCGDDVWYCQHCIQPECGKHMAECKRIVR